MAHFRAMHDPSGVQLGRDVHCSYRCFNNGDCSSYVARPRRRTSTSLLLLNHVERGNTYSAYDLEVLAVCEAVKHWRCYLEGCSNFLVITNHDTLRHLLGQTNNMLNKRQARYLRDLQPFVGSMTLAYREGALNEADPLSRRPDFVPHATIPLFWDGEVPLDRELRRKSHMLLEDAQLNLMTVNALQLSLEFADLIREGYSQDSSYGDEGEWTKDSRIEARVGYFWRLDRLCIPRKSELRLGAITELHESSLAIHKGVASTLAKALDRFWWEQIRQDVKDFCERCVVCRRAKIQPQMAATLHPTHVPPKPWHAVGLDYLTHLPKSNSFNNVVIVVDLLTRMAHFLPCTETVTVEETAILFLQGVYRLHGLPCVLVSDRDPKVVSGFWQTLWRRLGTRLNMSSSRHPETYGLTERVNGRASSLLLLLRTVLIGQPYYLK
jgi:hypothetical protein